MELHFNKWGNSLAARFPKALIEVLGITEGSTAQVDIVDGKVVISTDPLDKLKALSKGYTLESLLAQIPEGYDPTEDPEVMEWVNMKPIGKEIIDDDWS